MALTAVSALLGFSSYAWCHDEAHPGFFTGLVWAGGVVRGGLDDRHVAGHLCPAHAPVALDIARVSALAALFVGVSGIAVALLESRLDRFRLRFDSSVTAIVGADDDADSTVSAIARTLEKNSTLAVITTPRTRAAAANCAIVAPASSAWTSASPMRCGHFPSGTR